MEANICNNLVKKYNEIYSFILKNKTVMLPVKVCNYSRFEHTEDVKKTALLISAKLLEQNKELKIDNELVECIALYHDIGHCSYGHAGEECLNKLINSFGNRSDNIFSGYKHNILSAINLIEMDNFDVPWEIIDGVLKHSTFLPNNFRISGISDFNLLQLNSFFINETIRTEKPNWFAFIEKNDFMTRCNNCNYCKVRKLNDNNEKKFSITKTYKICKKNSYCDFTFYTKDIENDLNANLSRYFLISEPLTLEGRIVKFADEICGLLFDLFNYSQYINKNSEAELGDVYLRILNLIDCALNNADDNAEIHSFYENCKNVLEKFSEKEMESLRDFLISKIIIKNKNIGCLYTDSKEFEETDILLANNLQDEFLDFKKIIYSIIHKDKVIDENNKFGCKILSKSFNNIYKGKRTLLVSNGFYNQFKVDYLMLARKRHFSKRRFVKFIIANENLSNKEMHDLILRYKQKIVFSLARFGEEALKRGS